jgi:CRISPR-associated protein Cas2
MDYFICYDIHSPKRLVAISKVLDSYGFRMQKSFFACDLSLEELQYIPTVLIQKLNKKEDKVAIYPICNKCKMQGLYFGCNVETLFEKRFQIL